MSPDELKARARRIAQELLTQGDLIVAGEIFAPDCRHHAPFPIEPGPAGVRPWIVALRRAFPDLRASVEDAIADGNAVAMRLSLTGTHEGQWRGLEPTGQLLHWSVVQVLHAGADGTFTETWHWWDPVGPFQQPREGSERH
jgi:predicted ester cyclase